VNRDVHYRRPVLTVVRFGVSDMRSGHAFTRPLGFARNWGDRRGRVAFFVHRRHGARLFQWSDSRMMRTAARSAAAAGLRGMTMAWNCNFDGRWSIRCGAGFCLSRKGCVAAESRALPPIMALSGYFSDPDGHPWASRGGAGIEWGQDRRV